MSLKCTVVLVWVICLSCKVLLTGCEVVLVNRNVTDSFRVRNGGCTNDTSVCTSSATCQPDGSCLCSVEKPNFRNPEYIIDADSGGLDYGDSYGCVSSADLRSEVGLINHCVFGPFQLLPYSQQDPATNFRDFDNAKVVLKSCTLMKALAKFPDKATEMALQWLNNSYVDLAVFNETLDFKWKRTVPSLQGLIITLHFRCALSSSNSIVPKCLRAKVLGTWAAGKNSIDSTPVVTSTPMSLSQTSTITMSPTTSAKPNTQGSSSDDDSSGTIIIIAVVAPLVLLIVLVVVVWLLCKRKKGNSQRNSSRGSSGKKNGTANLKKFRHMDSNLRARYADEEGQARDTKETFGAQSNAGYSTPDSQRVVVEANTAYATPDLKRNEGSSANYNRAPGYEPVNMRKRESNENDSQADPGYATPDVKKREIDRVNSYPEPGYETPDIKKKEINVATADPAYSTPEKNTRDDNDNIERIDVNGDLYALPDKNKENNGINYMDPSQLVSDSQDRNESQAQSGQPTEYAEVVGVMKPAAKKPKKKK